MTQMNRTDERASLAPCLRRGAPMIARLLKNGMFYRCLQAGISLDDFIPVLDDYYINCYTRKRIELS